MKDRYTIMRSRFSRLLGAAVVLGALALPAAAQAAPGYYPSGPQTNVPMSVPTAAGWHVCYSATFAGSFTKAGIEAACTGDYLMFAGIRGSSDYTVLAAAPRADVLLDVGPDPAASHAANGSQWYYSSSGSWGFANGGDSVNRVPCDAETANAQLRMCWQTFSDTVLADA